MTETTQKLSGKVQRRNLTSLTGSGSRFSDSLHHTLIGSTNYITEL